MATAVVTGAGGLLGASLVRALLERGGAVRAVVREDVRALAGLDVEVVRADVRDAAAIAAAVAGADEVYHLAARIPLGRNRELTAVNVHGAATVAAACRRADIPRLVHFSSVHAVVGCGPYDRSKAAGERAARAAYPAAVIVRPVGVIGPHDVKPSHMGRAMLAMYRRTIPALVDGGFQWVDARDVAAAAIAAAPGPPLHVGGHSASLLDISRLIAKATGRPTVQRVCPMPLARAVAPLAALAARPLFTPASLAALRATLPASPPPARPLQETVADALEYFAAAGMLEPRRR